MSRFGFHPIIERWFASRFAGPTEPQVRGWPEIAAGRHTLIAAPTGSGKTLTAFLAVIDRLLREGLVGTLKDEMRVVYISPLRALSNDMQKNLSGPLAEIGQLAKEAGEVLPPLQVGLRTGDTSAYDRAKLVKNPPHILVTTPESLYLLLTSEKGRAALSTVDTVIVDEIHALARDKRGSHLALSLERLEHLVQQRVSGTALAAGSSPASTSPEPGASALPLTLGGLTPPRSPRLQRIGLSATQKPIERMARFLVGAGEIPDPVPVEPPPREKLPEPDGPGCHEEVDRAGQIASRPAPSSRPVDCSIVDVGHQRQLDLGIETPVSELSAVCSHESWAEVNARIVELINTHRSTVIFVNTRRMAERVTFQLTQILGDEAVSSHHGSLSAEIRLKTERLLKAGELKAVVATASLELGIDVGYIDLVIQIGSPRSIATFLQRIGRSGHALGLIPKGRLFALTRDELLEAMALVQAIRAGRLDVIPVPIAPLDVLAQQIVAEVATGEWNTADLYDRFRRAEPYRTLRRSQFDAVVKFLSEGVTDTGGRIHTLLHHDHVHGRLRARPNARLTSINNGGAIPETDVIRVVVEPEHTVVGSVDEEFGVESMAGDVFLLGNTSWQIEALRGSDLLVHDAHGAPPTIPFWRGEGPGRTMELSEEVSRLRREIEERVKTQAVSSQPSANQASRAASAPGPSIAQTPVTTSSSLSPASDMTSPTDSTAGERAGVRGPISEGGPLTLTLSPTATSPPNSTSNVGEREPDSLTHTLSDSSVRGLTPPGSPDSLDDIAQWLVSTTSCTLSAATQIVTYVAAQQAAVGLVPTQDRVIFERFFDETGGMQLVVHAPFGARINRAWGLAMRKRFCRSFDFELQATADDDGFILSLGPQHSFPIESLFPMLRADNVQNLLEQAILAVPMFQLRWRWNATRALLVARMRNGKKVPPALQRFRSDDLMTAVFPKLTGCQENITGDHVLPDHPLVEQTMYDCLNEALDIEGLLEVLRRVERGEIQFLARDTREPSPFSYELLNANPYAFLDGGEVQERRARAVQTRRTLSVNDVRDLGHLNPEAIAQVVGESQPVVRNADELHDVLLSRIVLPVAFFSEKERSFAEQKTTLGTADWSEWFRELRDAGRAALIVLPNGKPAWVSAERWPAARLVYQQATCEPPLEVPSSVRQNWEEIEALVATIRGYVEFSGPVTASEVAAEMSLGESQVFSSLEAIEGEGTVLRGRFRTTLDDQSPGVATPGLSGVEWCHRRLLARIHRLTVAGLRREIEAVDVPTFVRFLTRHQRLWPDSRSSGSNAVYEVISQLQGLDIAASAWEIDILPLRITDYKREWLDELSLTGEVTWGRLYPPARDPEKTRLNATLTRVAPVSICLREDLPWLLATAAPTSIETLGSQAQEVVQILSQRGAVFATDLIQQCRMLPSQLDDVLGELVTRGWVTADGFSGLRSLIREGDKSGGQSSGRGPRVVRHRRNTTGGRWTLWRSEPSAFSDQQSARTSSSSTLPWGEEPGVRAERRDSVAQVSGQALAAGSSISHPSPEPAAGAVPLVLGGLTPPRSPDSPIDQWAWQLLRRWGVVFRDLLGREPGAPRWWELLQVYRKLEARGEIRGGRFVAGVAGEQYALGDTIRELRQLKEQPNSGELVVISACDPLNLIGILGNDPRVPSLATNRIALFNGLPVGIFQGEAQLWPQCPKSLAPFISAQLRTGRTLAVAIPKATVKRDHATVESSRDPESSTTFSPPTASDAASTGQAQTILTPVEKLLNKRRPASQSPRSIPRPRIS